MNAYLQQFSLPLLAKELIEQAHRRRLFFMRVGYAVLLFTAAAIFIVPMVFGKQFTPIAFLGTGREIFQILMVMQFVGIYLFLPALTCGAIAAEKEHNTLALLFLTKLEPWTIIFEKLGSRIVPMFSLLLTSLPLMAFTYAWGGMEAFDLVCAIWFITLTIVQVGSYAILASAFCRSSPAAYVATMILLLASAVSLVILDELLLSGAVFGAAAEILQRHFRWFFEPAGYDLGALAPMLFFPPGLMREFTLGGRGSSIMAYTAVLLFSMPILVTSVISLQLAKTCLLSRAFLAPGSSMLAFFKILDHSLTWANNYITFGIVLVKESRTLPDDRPIEWREISKRSLGQFRYLVRVFVVLELPVLLIVSSFAVIGPSNRVGTEPISVVQGIVWVVTTLLISASASNLIAAERGRQTLDVLLTSPVSSRQIILEKIRGLRRLMLVCAVPLLSCAIFQTWWREQLSFQDQTTVANALQVTHGLRTQFYLWHEYLAANVLTICIYLPLTAWVSLALGVSQRSTTRAILGSLGTLALWCAIPALATNIMLGLIDLPPRENSLSILYLGFLTSPAGLIVAQEGPGLYYLHPLPYLAVLANSFVYGAILWCVRQRLLTQADQSLGRLSSTPPAAKVVVELAPIAAPATS